MRTAFVLAAPLLFSACRFKMPTIEEQKELLKRQSVGGDIPAWMARPAIEGTVEQQGFGLLPQSFGAPLAAAPVEVSSQERERDARLARALSKSPEDTTENSPLARIEAECPGIEQAVTTALTTLDTHERIAKYRTLTGQCSRSPDLWQWLAEDLYISGDFAEARSAVNQVLSLEPSNSQARSLQQKIASALAPSQVQ